MKKHLTILENLFLLLQVSTTKRMFIIGKRIKQMMNISVIWVPSILTTKILENSRYKKEMKVIAVDVKLLTAITFAIFFWIVLSVIGQA